MARQWHDCGSAAWRKTMPTITTFLKSDRLLCDRLFRRVEQAVRRRSWRSACCAIERFNRALKQHLLMEEQVLFKALEQYSSDAAKSVAAVLQEHRQLRQVAASCGQRDVGDQAVQCAGLFRRCGIAADDDARTLRKGRGRRAQNGGSFPAPGDALSYRFDALAAKPAWSRPSCHGARRRGMMPVAAACRP
jgi:hypothetical protein